MAILYRCVGRRFAYWVPRAQPHSSAESSTTTRLCWRTALLVTLCQIIGVSVPKRKTRVDPYPVLETRCVKQWQSTRLKCSCFHQMVTLKGDSRPLFCSAERRRQRRRGERNPTSEHGEWNEPLYVVSRALRRIRLPISCELETLSIVLVRYLTGETSLFWKSTWR